MYIFFILIILHDPTSCRALIFNRAEMKAVCLSVSAYESFHFKSTVHPAESREVLRVRYF